MKKHIIFSILLTAILTAALILNGCAKDSEETSAPTDEDETSTIDPAEIFNDGGWDFANTAVAPSIIMVDQIYDGDFIIEVPAFASGQLDSSQRDDALEALNAAIISFSNSAYDPYIINDGVFWSELKAYPYTSSSYVQIIMTKIEYPIYGTDGEIMSFNYEFQNDVIITLEDAISANDIDTAQIKRELSNSGLLSDTQSVVELTISAFRILDDGNADFYITAFIGSSQTDGWDSIFVYHTSDKSFESYSREILAGSDVPDVMDPPLYYGR